MYLEFDGIYGTDRKVLETEHGIIKRMLYEVPPQEKGRERKRVSVIKIKGYAYPGFHDSHMHLIGLGKKLSTVDCVGSKSVEEMAERIRDFLRHSSAAGRSYDETSWVLGRGWNQDLFADRRLPTRHDLDRVSCDIPIAVHRVCGHIAVLNTKALQLTGLIDADGCIDSTLLSRIRSRGGEVDLEEGGTLPTGILREYACDLIVSRHSSDELAEFIRKAQEHLFSVGITSVQTDDLYFAEDWREIVALFEKMETEGSLRINVYEQSQIKSSQELRREYIQSKTAERERRRFRLGPLKILSDGSLGARTAYMTEPYADDPSTRGILTVREDILRDLMFAAAESGTDSVVHGIGDGAIGILLEINEEIQRRNLSNDTEPPTFPVEKEAADSSVEKEASATPIAISRAELRNTVVHCQVMSAEQIDRMARLGVGAMVQPIFLEYDLGIIESRVGAEKARTSYAYRTMLDKGIRLAFGSDAPVEDPNPLRGMHFAVNRHTEAITLEEAIRAYTVESAYYSYEEDRKGEIKEGYVADLAVFEERLTPENLLSNRCIATLVDGETVYRSDRRFL